LVAGRDALAQHSGRRGGRKGGMMVREKRVKVDSTKANLEAKATTLENY
jgi:hypothetical protein